MKLKYFFGEGLECKAFMSLEVCICNSRCVCTLTNTHLKANMLNTIGFSFGGERVESGGSVENPLS